MSEGWVSFHRKIKDWEWYTDSNTFRLFFHLVLTANHKPNNWKGIEIKRGQLVIGRKQLALELKLSEQQIRTSFSKLKSTNEITTKATNKFTLVTVVNYEVYQDTENKATNKTPTKKPTSNQQVTTNNNDNNENKKDIVDYLNEKALKSYKHTTAKTKTLIQARENEGFTFDDFKIVIDSKVKQWGNDPKMKQYIRPETLFGTKFESYLNENIKQSEPKYKGGIKVIR